MTLSQFISKWTGQKCCLGGRCQCVALARQYIQDVLKFPQFPTVNSAYQVFDIADIKYYTKIKNTASNYPKAGDIIIWSKSYGGYGHIAIVKSADVKGVLSFDQNYTGKGDLPQLVNHNYSYVMGWLRPKGVSMGTMYRQKDEQTVWLYFAGSRLPLTDPKQVEQLGGWSKVKVVSVLPNYLNKCPICPKCPPDVRPQLDSCIIDVRDLEKKLDVQKIECATKLKIKDQEIEKLNEDLSKEAEEQGIGFAFRIIIESIKKIWSK